MTAKITVPWAYITWDKMTDDLKRLLRHHLTELDDMRRDDYCKYLIHFCGYPVNFRETI